MWFSFCYDLKKYENISEMHSLSYITGRCKMTKSIEQQIKLLKKKKERALEAIIDVYMPYVKAIALRILSNTTTVDECVNDVFLAVWQKSAQFEGNEVDFKRWIGVMTKYKAIDLYRQQKRRREHEVKQEDMTYFATISEPQQLYLQKEERQEMLVTLSQLAETDRDIFIMKYYLEMDNSEIAEALELTKAAVDNRLYRGKKKLATQQDRGRTLYEG